MVQGPEEIVHIKDYDQQYATANTFFGDAVDTESDDEDQSSSCDEPNESLLPNEISHAIVPQAEDSGLDF